jgi:hypothetical protein
MSGCARTQPVDEQRNHAPSMFGPPRVSMHAQARDRAQQLLGGDIRANLAGRCRGNGTARARTLPHGAAAVLHTGSRHRARSAPCLRTLWNGSDGLEPAFKGHAHRPLPQGTAAARRKPAADFPMSARIERCRSPGVHWSAFPVPIRIRGTGFKRRRSVAALAARKIVRTPFRPQFGAMLGNQAQAPLFCQRLWSSVSTMRPKTSAHGCTSATFAHQHALTFEARWRNPG